MNPVEDFGAFLKNERELRGITLEEISGATKIHRKFLIALETNDFDQLPGDVFIKGYIRSYAKIIGADVQEILNSYEESVGKQRRETLAAADPLPAEGTSGPLKLIMSLILLAGLGIGIYFWTDTTPPSITIQDTEKSEPQLFESFPEPESETIPSPELETSAQTDSPEPEETPEILTEETPVQETPEPKLAEPLSEQEDNAEKIVIPDQKHDTIQPPSPIESMTGDEKESVTTEPQVENPEDAENKKEIVEKKKPAGTDLKLEIITTAKSWFHVTIDDKDEQDFILPMGSNKIILAHKFIKMTIGNGEGVELKLNGKKLTLPMDDENIVRDFIIMPNMTD